MSCFDEPVLGDHCGPSEFCGEVIGSPLARGAGSLVSSQDLLAIPSRVAYAVYIPSLHVDQAYSLYLGVGMCRLPSETSSSEIRSICIY